MLKPAEERYHRTMHRVYRAVRARVALRISPFSRDYAPAVREAFAREVVLQELRPPK